MKHAYRWTALLVLSLLSACGGGGHHGSSTPAAYAIGGSITGLTAGGLVLLDNGGDTLQVPANATSYSFPTKLGSGIAYAVTIQTQPSGLSCSIANASGTVASSDVNNVNVTCSPQATFTIGGSISGLTASGLVLMNGSDTVSPAAKASSFTFQTAVATGTTYDVGIKTQPTGESCSVTNPSGKVASSDITNVSVSCSPLTTFTVGGSISGLTASGLVLQDNGGDDLTVQAYGATFTFATALASGSAYAVTVETNPAGETCQVTDGSSTVSANVTTVVVTCTTGFTGTTGSSSGGANVATVVVGPGPADPDYQTFNMPYTSIKVCNTANPQKCAVIDDVQVDTGSSGLRLLASALASANLTLTPAQDSGGNPIEECYPFGGTYFSWGAVASATVTIGGETTSNPIPVQVIDDSTLPSGCGSGSGLIRQSGVNDFDANGVLGVGLFPQDCGTDCTTSPPPNGWYYYSCPPSPSTCMQTTVTLAGQVTNPVTAFTTTTDDNGVALQLPTVPAGGAATVTGYLVFGIDTESNNSVGSATILTPDASGYISTQVTGQSAVNGFFDSGSNYLAFDDSALLQCTTDVGFYCPTSTPQSVTATNVDTNSVTSIVMFPIANIEDELTANPDSFAISDVGGLLSGSFDWGLPFFYGRTVFTAIQGATISGTMYPNGFYAY